MGKHKKSEFWLSIEELTPDQKDKDRVALLMQITGVQQGSVSRWKNGNPPIGNRNALKVATAFRCNVHWLQTNQGDMRIANEDDPTIQRITAVLDELTNEDREDLAELAEMKARRRRGA